MNNENNSYYECKRCFYKCYQKNHMKNHLNKKKICEKKFEAYKYSDNDLMEMSLIRQYKYTDIKIFNNDKSTNNKIEYICKCCNKKLHTNSSLQRHMKLYCKYNKNTDKCIDEVSESIINNIDNSIYIDNSIIDNSITDNSTTININIVNSFSEEWCTKHIDDKTKALLFLNNAKFTATLENILENEVNLNVLIDKKSENGIIYENNIMKNTTVKDIVSRTMEKIYKHLTDFKTDAYTHNIDNDVINSQIKLAGKKYDEFQNSKKVREKVNTCIKDIYCKKQTNTYDSLNKVEKDGY